MLHGPRWQDINRIDMRARRNSIRQRTHGLHTIPYSYRSSTLPWRDALGTTITAPLHTTPIPDTTLRLVFPDGRVLDAASTPKGLRFDLGFLCPPGWAPVHTQPLRQMAQGWRPKLLAWDTLGRAHSAHTALQRGRPSPTGQQIFILSTSMGIATIAHPLWHLVATWESGRTIKVDLHLPEAPKAIPAASFLWEGHAIQEMARLMERTRPSWARLQSFIWPWAGAWDRRLAWRHPPQWLGLPSRP